MYLTDGYNEYLEAQERREQFNSKACWLCEDVYDELDLVSHPCTEDQICENCLKGGRLASFIKSWPQDFDVELELQELELIIN